MTKDQRLILHIDMNSYFATVEQQANPTLRGKPVGVKGSLAKRTIVVAASVEAKKYGVKTGMRVHEALEICPELILVVGESRKYSSVTKQFIDIFEKYTDRVEIFSIDEAFLDVTQTARLFEKKQITNNKSQINSKIQTTKPVILVFRQAQDKLQGGQNQKYYTKLDSRCGGNDKKLIGDFSGAIGIAKRIKSDIRNEIGEWITCSVGVASNKFLAKLGSDLEKPDGLVVIDEKNKDKILLSCELTEFCGIASRLERRLNYMNIFTVQDLRNADDYKLKKEFGVYGLKMKRMAFGVDHSEVLDWHDQADAKSFGHSRTLNKDVTNRKEIEKHIYLLSEKIAKRMRDEKFFGKEVGIWIRFKDFSETGKRHRVGYFLNDGHDIYKVAVKILEELLFGDGENHQYSHTPVRAIGVYVSRISKNAPFSLLPEETKKEKILKLMDEINNRFGDDILFRGTLLDFPLKEIVSGMGRKKF